MTGDVSENTIKHLTSVERTVYIAHKLHLHIALLENNLLAT